MPTISAPPLQPRKSPVQARSAASVNAILEATLQVLLAVGKERLTTTRVAARAGVSVGTLYQYFPNKSALLQAALKRHMTEVAEAVEAACHHTRGQPLQQIATALITAFFAAKMRSADTSVALCAVSSDVDGATVVKQVNTRVHAAVVALLTSTSDHLTTDPQIVAAMLQGAMAGISRRLLESPNPQQLRPTLEGELIVCLSTYLQACTRQPNPRPPHRQNTRVQRAGIDIQT